VPVGVEGELVPVDALAVDGIGDERFGERTGLGGRDAPGDDVAGVDVDDHEQLVVNAALGAGQLRVGVRPEALQPQQRPAHLAERGAVRG
jgi:hypothetical protein